MPRCDLKEKHRNIGLQKKKHKKAWEETHGYHPFGYYPVDKNGNYTRNEEEIAYYKRDNGYQARKKLLKRQSNKKIRKFVSEEALKGGEYKKVFDYWWELY